MIDLEELEEQNQLDWRLLAWPLSGFLVGIIGTGAFALFAFFH